MSKRFSFERQTYWYERVEESFALKSTRAEDTKFPLGFPFGFAGRVFKSKYKITNSFFVDAPITIRITGAIANNIRLYLQSLDGKTIEEIALSTNNADGTEILIEPTTKKNHGYDGRCIDKRLWFDRQNETIVFILAARRIFYRRKYDRGRRRRNRSINQTLFIRLKGGGGRVYRNIRRKQKAYYER